MADEVLQQGVRGITDLMVMPGLINLDFADVRSVMGEMGKAMMGTGEATATTARSRRRAGDRQPLLDGVSMKGAKGVIISITGGEDMRLMEVDEAASHIKELVDPDANIIWGSAFNNDLKARSASRSWPPASMRSAAGRSGQGVRLPRRRQGKARKAGRGCRTRPDQGAARPRP
jgi:cell division GTPase FtsZ